MPAPRNTTPTPGRIVRTRLEEPVMSMWWKLLREQGGTEAEHLRNAIRLYAKEMGYTTTPTESK